MNSFLDYLEHFWISLSSFPVIIQVAIFFIFFSSLATFTLIGSVVFVRKIKKRNQGIVQELRPRMFSFLRNILIAKDEYSEVEVYNLFVENFGHLNKKAYLSLIPTLEDVVKQEQFYVESANYQNIIKGLKIDSHLERRLDFSSTRMRLRAFQSLSRLELTISDSKILPHTYSKNESLRKESRASYVGISNNDPFKFFEVDNNMNEWDQISLMQQFILHHKHNLPNFTKWIKYSNNPAQIKFFIKVVAYFNQTTSIDTLIELLDGEDHSIRKEAILALGKMHATAVEPRLVKMYFTQPLACQDAIIEAISFLNTGKSIGFLKTAYEMANNSDSKKLIAEVIYLYGKLGKKLFNELEATEADFNLLILNHVKNPLIPSALKAYHQSTVVYKDATTRIRRAKTETLAITEHKEELDVI
jgi:hypothetical protein